MLDLIAQTFGNLDQAGLLIAGAACLVLGAVLAGGTLYSRLRGTRVRGRVIGVRADDNIYYPVYRYQARDGVEHEAMSTTGSSDARGKETGRELTLLTFPNRPSEAGEPASYAFDVAGWFLLLVGGGLLYLALSLRPVSAGTWLMLGLLAAYLAVNVQRAWRPARSRGSLAGLERWADVPIVPIEDLIGRPADAGQRNVNRLWGPMLLALGFGLFGLGIYLFLEPPVVAAGAWNWVAPLGLLAIGTFFSWIGVGITRRSWQRA